MHSVRPPGVGIDRPAVGWPLWPVASAAAHPLASARARLLPTVPHRPSHRHREESAVAVPMELRAAAATT